ncbi:UNVERIFIED_CONTAM: hypothetical protein GTU68_051803 [Idotea baltica]|nr:hypothetical protein [Idotea baltica]
MSSFSCKQQGLDYQSDKIVHAPYAMVSSAHPLASDAGVEVLKQGGNAVDAAVAVQFALAVVYPRAGNVGGGGFMVYRDKNGKSNALDFREMAPGLARRDMYLDINGNVIPGLSRFGGLAIGVPGSVDGMVHAHKSYGHLDWSALLGPSIVLAKQGYQITQIEADRLNTFKEEFIENNKHITNAENFPFVKTSTWQEGDLLRQPKLAATLQRISDQGRAGFYKGKTAAGLLKTILDRGGIIRQEDLNDYESFWRKPIETDYKGHRIISMPPPSSGGIALVQLLEIVEHLDLSQDPQLSSASIHKMVEAEHLVFADRAKHLGDADYYPVPVDALLDPIYLAELATSIPLDSARLSENIYTKDFEDLESYETTHFSIVDQAGNAVSITTTLNSNYGSKVFEPHGGYFLNNEMDDFSAKPGVPNLYGLIGNEANAIQPGKRMLSSMTPTIVEKGNALHSVIGTPGGSTIITSVFQIIVNMLDYNQTLYEAIEAPRFHHQWLPDQIMVEENKFDPLVLQQLRDMGHTIKTAKYIGLVDAVAREEGGWIGVGDPRGDDDAEGY